MPTFKDRLVHSWNAFMNKDPTDIIPQQSLFTAPISSYRPDRTLLSRGNERSIVTSVYNRIAMDCAAIQIEHVKLDADGRFLNVVDSGLNNCLTLSANQDQTGRAFIQDVVISMFDEGCVAIVPTDVDVDNPMLTTSYEIEKVRTGRIVEWIGNVVKINAYDERIGQRKDIYMPKDKVAIIENPFYAIMNEPNSTLKRLTRKLVLLDAVDEQTSSGKLNLIIQLPYAVKTDARRQQVEKRRKDIEEQLSGNKYGIAYIDGTEHITQLNRSVDNQLMSQIEYLTNLLYSQLGITTAILDGTADEKTMLNYMSRCVEPIMSAIVDEMKRKFLTKTARSQKHSIMFFKDPFKLVPVGAIADIADRFTRNEIMSTNEVRQIMGMKPVNDPRADELRNKNMPMGDNQDFATTTENPGYEDDYQLNYPEEEYPEEQYTE